MKFDLIYLAQSPGHNFFPLCALIGSFEEGEFWSREWTKQGKESRKQKQITFESKASKLTVDLIKIVSETVIIPLKKVFSLN